MAHETCEQRIDASLASTLEDIREGFADETFSEYGLGFDYVAPGTFTDQNEGYYRFQISWGGPATEFRFFSSTPHHYPYRIEYWFLDWGDGARRDVSTDEVALEVWEWFEGAGAVESAYEAAV